MKKNGTFKAANANILVTGGAGFIGSNFIRYVLGLASFKGRIINYDKLTYAGNLASLKDVARRYGPWGKPLHEVFLAQSPGKGAARPRPFDLERKDYGVSYCRSTLGSQSKGRGRYSFVKGDICDYAKVLRALKKYKADAVVHFAAESHVDRSIFGPGDFIETNIHGTFSLLEAARHYWAGRKDVRFHHISTDEVYGSLGRTGAFLETTPYDPRSPYSASKASSDHIARSYYHTYGLPVTVSNCSNNYGPYHYPEKLIPLLILNALAGKPLPVYGDGLNVRDWLYVGDHCAAIWDILRKGSPGETYNVGGSCEKKNIDVVKAICRELELARPAAANPALKGRKYSDLITFVKDRPGHDRRYAIDASRIRRELGWKPAHNFENGLKSTIAWYLQNPAWLASIQKASYSGWLKKNYLLRK